MDRKTKIKKIVALINQSNNEIESKKKLHKLVYLLQQLNEDFDQKFIFHHYGVFSPSLAEDMEIGELFNNLSISQNKSEFGFKISIDDSNTEIKNPYKFEKNIKSKIDILYKKEARFLEVLSTIVYLNNNYYSDEELIEKLFELKPNLSGFYDEAFNLAQKLYGIKVKI